MGLLDNASSKHAELNKILPDDTAAGTGWADRVGTGKAMAH